MTPAHTKNKTKRNKYPKTSRKPAVRTVRNEIPVSPSNRIIYVFKESNAHKAVEVTCVSLDIKIDEDWITIVYYDSFHGGRLHRHTRVSYSDKSDAPTHHGVKSRGSQNKLLTWAIKDLFQNYLKYKKDFLKRSKDNLQISDVELY